MSSPGRPVSSEFSPEDDQSAGFIVHEVKPTDTLEGISLKYGVSVADVKKANKLFSSMIHGHFTLKIPVDKRTSIDKSGDKEATRRRLVRKLQLELRCPAEDAKFVLERADWVYKDALKVYHQIMAEADEKVRAQAALGAVPKYVVSVSSKQC